MRGGRLNESLDRDTLVTIYFVTEESKSHPGRRSYRLTRKEISRLACSMFSGFVSLTLFWSSSLFLFTFTDLSRYYFNDQCVTNLMISESYFEFCLVCLWRRRKCAEDKTFTDLNRGFGRCWLHNSAHSEHFLSWIHLEFPFSLLCNDEE